jgi:hypothetical protein
VLIGDQTRNAKLSQENFGVPEEDGVVAAQKLAHPKLQSRCLEGRPAAVPKPFLASVTRARGRENPLDAQGHRPDIPKSEHTRNG